EIKDSLLYRFREKPGTLLMRLTLESICPNSEENPWMRLTLESMCPNSRETPLMRLILESMCPNFKENPLMRSIAENMVLIFTTIFLDSALTTTCCARVGYWLCLVSQFCSNILD